MTVAVHCCPVCRGNSLHEFLRRNAVPVHQNLVLASQKEALKVVRGDLALTLCNDCGFVFNKEFDHSKLAYGVDYDNVQSHSSYFARYMVDLAEYLLREINVRSCRIVEVGCGKGEFLRLLVAHPGYGNTGVGFDPSYVGPESDLDERLRFEGRFYDESCTDVPADVVVCRHVIEHVPQPLELLGSVRMALQNAHAPRIYFETPCVEWILRNRVIWDFFYEHCSLFSDFSLRLAFDRAGFAVHKVRHVFGGQYLWLEASLAETSGDFVADAGSIPTLTHQFAEEEAHLRTEWRSRLVALSEQGKVAIWGAGAKGTTFVHLVDPDCRLVDCLVDLNPNKQGKYVPGTGHPIVGVEALPQRSVSVAILMNPNYREENEKLLAVTGINVQLLE